MLTGWDPTELAKYELDDGTSVLDVFNRLTAALGVASAELSGGIWGQLVTFTDRPETSYRIGASNGFEEHTEYARPDPKRAATEGHMIPYKEYDRALGWTYDYLTKHARMNDVEADIIDAVNDAKNNWRLRILGRLLKRGDDTGAAAGLGSTGESPGFATTAGSTGVDYTPPSYGGASFSDTHEHYVAVTGGWADTTFTDIAAELREHGHEAPYTVIASGADEAQIRGLTGFIPTGTSIVSYGVGTTLAAMSGDPIAPGVYPIGVNGNCVIYIVPGMPQYYGFGWKAYGPLSQRNPLLVRLWKGQRTINIMGVNDPSNGSPAHPLQYMMLKMDFGVGVNDRTNGTPRYTNSNTWTDGVAT
jgi:hypothetical protein